MTKVTKMNADEFKNAFFEKHTVIIVLDNDGKLLDGGVFDDECNTIPGTTIKELAERIVSKVPCRIEKVWSGNNFHYGIYVL